LTHEFISSSRVFGVSGPRRVGATTFFGPFGFKSGRDVDKLAKVTFKKGGAGCPLITEHSLSVLEAEVIDRIDLGSHSIFVADVISSEVLKTGRPMTYHYFHEHLKGKSPRNAPTFEPPS